MPSDTSSVSYRGRFAPSPSGPLHFGSLVCALASYLDAKQHQGQWLVRMEDIDPPREEPGAQHSICSTLQAHGLYWDEAMLFQSQRSSVYNQALQTLENRKLTYPCSCNRSRLIGLDGHYDDHCRNRPPSPNEPYGIRLKTDTVSTRISSQIHFNDRIKGPQVDDIAMSSGDYLIHRKDGLFAYQLAVVVDDIAQGITDIVRGDDLLDSTSRQIFLNQILGGQIPSYAHIPVVLGTDGNKLSKQNHAPALNNDIPESNLVAALNHLGVATPPTLIHENIETILKYGCERFHRVLAKLA